WSSPDATQAAEMDRLLVRGFLTMMADKSGGEAWFPSGEMMFRPAMESVMGNLAAQYKLNVHSVIPDDGRFHRIKVEAFSVTGDKRKNYKVRVREGFRGQ